MEESINYQSCCRLCLCEKADTLKPIFDQTNNDLQLSQKILHSLTIQINNSDPVTTMVCEDCIEKITNWNFYKQQCIENQKKFQELLDCIVPVPPVTPSPVPALSASENTTPNSNNVSMGEMTFHIKEEPADHDINDETREIIQEAMPENIVQQNDQQQICVKNEPLDVDEPMDQEYNEFPPSLSPHPFGLADSESDPAPNRDPDINRKCSVCGKIFSNAGNRKKHERVQHGLHPTVCVSSPINKANDITNGFSTSDAAKEQQKILFAMGLKLLQTNSKPISSDELSKIEVSYSEKCKAMVSMHKSLVCACHNVPHQNLKGLLSHLRALRIWFPVFTCYNCMITFTDRSTFTRHIARCSSQALNAITKLSNLKKRSEVKTRLYQNFKCTICKFMFSFHEDFCAHVDEDHSLLQFPVHCPCGRVFENVEDYKDHVYVSCLVDFYCDICFITTKTLDDFQKHAKEVHDQSEGFILLQDDNYKVKKPSLHSTPGVDESAILTGKRERRASARAPLALQDDDLDEVPSAVVKPTFHTPRTDNRICPICHKEYSSYKNMMRHYKNHKDVDINRKQQGHDMDLEDKASYYSCPECGGMFSMEDWEKHLAEKHPSTPCDECGKLFQFQSDLEQHRSTHLNLKVYRDSKTHAYKSAMVSPKSEGDVMLLCEICDVMFTTKEDLKNHKLTHELEDMNADSDPSMDANLDQLDLDIEPNIELAMEQSMETGDVDVMDNTRKFRCEVCEEEFNSYSGLWEHNRTKHPDRKTPNVDTYPKECKDCGKVCTTGAAFYRHRQIHEKPSINTVSRTSLLKKKLSENSDESYHTCKRCFKVFSSKYNLKNHLKCHGINPASGNRRMSRKAVCKICQQIFETQEELILHRKEQHFLEVAVKTEAPVEEESLIFTCDICVMTFNNKTALKKHKEKHNQVPRTKKMVFCKHCKIPFETIAQLTQHMVTEHDQRVKKKVVKYTQQVDGYSCNICKKSFGSAGALTTHIGWHKRAQNETNTKLMKPVTQSKAKVTVKEEPNEVKRLQCSTCFISLPNDTALQVHILEKHRSVSAIMLVPRCNTCNKDFASQEEYETHKRLHDFLERQKQHEQKMLVRQQEQKFSPNTAGPKVKSYPCKHCNAAFSRSDTLGAHMRQFHKDYIATEFRCHYCDRVFEKQNSLTIHLKVHEKQRNMQVPPSKPLFACSICNMGFDLPKDLRAHTISAHPF